MKAVKGNKEYAITEEQVKFYQDAGFDIVDGNGNVVTYGRGKTVSVEEYMEMKAELESARKELEDIRSGRDNKNDDEVAGILKEYAGIRGIDTGQASSISGIMKKIRESGTGGGR